MISAMMLAVSLTTFTGLVQQAVKDLGVPEMVVVHAYTGPVQAQIGGRAVAWTDPYVFSLPPDGVLVAGYEVGVDAADLKTMGRARAMRIAYHEAAHMVWDRDVILRKIPDTVEREQRAERVANQWMAAFMAQVRAAREEEKRASKVARPAKSKEWLLLLLLTERKKCLSPNSATGPGSNIESPAPSASDSSFCAYVYNVPVPGSSSRKIVDMRLSSKTKEEQYHEKADTIVRLLKREMVQVNDHANAMERHAKRTQAKYDQLKRELHSMAGWA